MSKLTLDLAERFDLPASAVGELKLTISGTSRALIENHRGLLSYTEDTVELDGGICHVRVHGDGLTLRAMSRTAVIVSGRIFGVDVA